jgi:hypothetical protein
MHVPQNMGQVHNCHLLIEFHSNGIFVFLIVIVKEVLCAFMPMYSSSRSYLGNAI